MNLALIQFGIAYILCLFIFVFVLLQIVQLMVTYPFILAFYLGWNCQPFLKICIKWLKGRLLNEQD